MFSVDFPIPIYLGEGYDVSVSIGEAVIVIQNSQRKIPTGMYCTGKPFYMSGKNPLAPLLMSVGAGLAGLSHSHSDSRYTSASSAHLCGQSPVFSGVGVVTPTFSELDLVHLLFISYVPRCALIVKYCRTGRILSQSAIAIDFCKHLADQGEVGGGSFVKPRMGDGNKSEF